MKNILIVDDNLTNLEQISIQIEDDFDVTLAKSGAQCLLICDRAVPDLILLDIEMPDMDGFETFAKLRENRSLRAIPVIFLTASHDPKVEVKALLAGAQDFISKPVEREILLHRLQTHLDLAEAKAQISALAADLEDSLIASFSDLLEGRGSSFGKAQRTSRYVRFLGDELRARDAFPGHVNENNIALLSRAAPLYDVGKLAISESVLLKPAMLNDEEFAAIKNHVTLGASILQKLFQEFKRERGFEDYAVAMALSHHERWDGKGYPHGLKGENIPFCARLMAVADVFDALVDARVYKKPLSFPDAFRAILSGSGTVFDPTIVEAFRAAKDKFGAVAEELRP
ncbi:MAG: response regulator [Deltaproteobacteria bacterium]|jgi:putative two-component system response regulator|nr:response regulator [Deltaproteobacteria bacterium]